MTAQPLASPATRATRRTRAVRPAAPALGTSDLALVVRRVASVPRLWRPAVGVGRAGDRPWVRLDAPAGVDLRLATWLPSQATDLHDHGDAACAFAVVQGSVTELRADVVLGSWVTELAAPAVRVVEPGIVHRLRNDSRALAVTLHAYSPDLSRTNRYELVDDEPVVCAGDDPGLLRDLAC